MANFVITHIQYVTISIYFKNLYKQFKYEKFTMSIVTTAL